MAHLEFQLDGEVHLSLLILLSFYFFPVRFCRIPIFMSQIFFLVFISYQTFTLFLRVRLGMPTFIFFELPFHRTWNVEVYVYVLFFASAAFFFKVK